MNRIRCSGPMLWIALSGWLVGSALLGCSPGTPTTSPTTGSPSPTGSSTGASPTPQPGPAKRPNIVFVLTDDLAGNLLPYMPNVKAMQRAGATMNNFFVVDSLCCPSRAATLTGSYPHNNGVFTNSGSDGGYQTFLKRGNEQRTFAVALQRAGYTTGFMGKYLNGYQPTDPVPPGWNTWAVAGEGYKQFDYQLNENGKVVSYRSRPQDYLTDVMSAKAQAFIDSANRAGKSFLLELATFGPHAPSTPAPRHANLFPGLKAPRTAAFAKRPADAPSWLTGLPPLTAQNTANIDRSFRLRAQNVRAIDEMIGALQRQLAALGLADETYLVFSSDNGYHMGEHGLRPGKQTAFDTDIRVPLVVTGPGVPAGHQVNEVTSNIDLAPTFQTLGGVPVPPHIDGANMLALWQGKTPPPNWRQAVLIEHHGPNSRPDDPDKAKKKDANPPTYAAIRTGTALYVQYADGQREYYDVSKDPNQLRNLAGSAPPATLAPLQRALTALTKCTGQGVAGCQAAARLN